MFRVKLSNWSTSSKPLSRTAVTPHHRWISFLIHLDTVLQLIQLFELSPRKRRVCVLLDGAMTNIN